MEENKEAEVKPKQWVDPSELTKGEKLAKDFTIAMHMLESLGGRISRGGLLRALIFALKFKIDEPPRLLFDEEKAVSGIVGRLIDLKILLLGELYKQQAEDELQAKLDEEKEKLLKEKEKENVKTS